MIFSEPIIVTKFAPPSGADAGFFEGLASSWLQDRHGDVIARGAFADSVAALSSGSTRVPLLANHRTDQQVGGIKSATETDEGLLVTGMIVRGSPVADRIYDLSKANQMGLSVGFMPVEGAVEKIPSGGSRFSKVDLVEVSAVATPSNRESRVLRIKELAEIAPAELESLLRDGELPPMPRRLAAKLTRAWLAALDREDDEPDPAELAAVQSALAGLTSIFKRK